MRTYLFVLLVVAAVPVMAQETPDAGLPDASVEQGGADRSTEENDAQGGPCLDSRDCSQGFACVDTRCVPTKPRSIGCSEVPGAWVTGAVLLALRRRGRASNKERVSRNTNPGLPERSRGARSAFVPR